MKKVLIAATVLLLSAVAPNAAEKPKAKTLTLENLNPVYACPPAPLPSSLEPNWPIGITSRDDLITVWCKIKNNVPDTVKFNILFVNSQVMRTWTTDFSKNQYSANQILKLLQSVTPLSDVPVRGDNGQDMSKIWENTAQLSAEASPTKLKLGFPEYHPAANQIALWEPIALRVKPVMIGGKPFSLKVLMVPNAGMLSLALQGKAPDHKVLISSKMLGTGSYFQNDCNEFFPSCSKLGNYSVVHMPYIVEKVALEASGDNLTTAAAILGNKLTAENSRRDNVFVDNAFKLSNGSGYFMGRGQETDVRLDVEGEDGDSKRVKMVYGARKGKGTYRELLANVFKDYKKAFDKQPVTSNRDLGSKL